MDDTVHIGRPRKYGRSSCPQAENQRDLLFIAKSCKGFFEDLTHRIVEAKRIAHEHLLYPTTDDGNWRKILRDGENCTGNIDEAAFTVRVPGSIGPKWVRMVPIGGGGGKYNTTISSI
jgi:hypothetical protein